MKFPKSKRYYLARFAKEDETTTIEPESTTTEVENPEEESEPIELTPEELESLLNKAENPASLGEDEDIRVRDTNERVFWLEGEVGEKNTINIIKKIRQYNCDDVDIPIEDRLPIRIMINSPGGDAHSMRILGNLIRMSKTPVMTIVCGLAESAGAFILASGCKRYAIPGSTIMVHSSFRIESGTREKLNTMHAYYERFEDEIDAELLERTKISKEDLIGRGAFDWYMTPEEALKFGVIDEILTDLDTVFF